MIAKRFAAAAAALSLLCGTALAGQERTHGQVQAIEAETPHTLGAAGNDFIVLELTPAPGQQHSAEDMLMMQMLLLQLLMQQEPSSGETQIIVPSAASGVAI
jgi:hypothetical protein